MSERKSWDIQPKRRPQPQPARQESAPVQAPKPRPKPRPVKITTKPRQRTHHSEPITIVRPVRRERIPQGKEREPLKARRRRARRRAQTVASIFLLFLIIGFFVITWLPAFRIQHVEASGTDASGMQSVANTTLVGTIDYVFPRNSIFFFPQKALRAAILAKFPDVSAVSISRTSFDAISLASISRETAFLWCGATYAKSIAGNAVSVLATSTTATAASTSSTTPSEHVPASGGTTQSNCYDADAQGYVYANVAAGDLSADLLHVYGALAGSNPASPLGERISGASHLPNELEFVKAMKTLGVSVTTLVLRSDEADLYAQSGTRITYVIGQEAAAAQLAQSAFPTLNLNDGSLEYVDLRFPGKVYYKAFNASAQEAGTTNGQ